MIDLVIVHPGGQHGIYGALGSQLTALEPPPWARMIAGYVRDRSYKVLIIDQDAQALTADMIAGRVESLNPRLVAITVHGHQPSASTQAMVAAGQVAQSIKWANPKRKVLMCGNHPSALPRRTLLEEMVDYVADGEAALTIVGLLNSGFDEHVFGLHAMHEDGTTFEAPRAPLLDNLHLTLHGDVWDLLPMHVYRAHNWHAFTGPRQPYASIYTSLGCPFACSFCMINVFQHTNRYRTFEPAFVVEQVRKLNELYGVQSLKIADEMFVLNEAHYTAICEGLKALGRDLNIWAYARVDTVKADKLRLMREAGIKWLALGIESGSAEVRDGANKKLRRGDIVDVVREIQRAGINVIGNFMFGFEQDTPETMQETLDLARACLPEFANFYCNMPYPGSKLYNEASKEGSWMELPPNWSAYSQHNEHCSPLNTRHLPASKVLAFRDAAFRDFFSSSAYRSMVLSKFGPNAEAQIESMLDYKLKRNLLAA